jgi:undecaprenyl-diphosphatase
MRARLLKHGGFGLLATGVLLGAPALAAQRLPAPPAVRFDVRPVRDGVTLGLAGALALTPMVLEDRLPHATCAPCNPGALLGIDRGAVGVVDTGWSRASDVALVTTGAATALLLWTARRGEPDAWRASVEDWLVLAQAASAADAATNWLKVLAQRPRPPRYSAQAPLYGGAEYGLSFPSSHATLAFSAAAAYWSIQRRRGQAGRHTAEIVGLFALASLTAAARVRAHAHFPTDVLAGAMVGTAVGWFWPRLHPIR